MIETVIRGKVTVKVVLMVIGYWFVPITSNQSPITNNQVGTKKNPAKVIGQGQNKKQTL